MPLKGFMMEKIFAFIVFIGLTFSTDTDITNFNILKIPFIIFVWPLFYCLWNMFLHHMSSTRIIPEYCSELSNEFRIIGKAIKKVYNLVMFVVNKIRNREAEAIEEIYMHIDDYPDEFNTEGMSIAQVYKCMLINMLKQRKDVENIANEIKNLDDEDLEDRYNALIIYKKSFEEKKEKYHTNRARMSIINKTLVVIEETLNYIERKQEADKDARKRADAEGRLIKKMQKNRVNKKRANHKINQGNRATSKS